MYHFGDRNNSINTRRNILIRVGESNNRIITYIRRITEIQPNTRRIEISVNRTAQHGEYSQ